MSGFRGPNGSSRRPDKRNPVPFDTPAFQNEQPSVTRRKKWPVSGSEILFSRLVDIPIVPSQTLVVARSDFERRSRGPILNSFRRPWWWRQPRPMQDGNLGTVAVGDVYGSKGGPLPSGAVQQARPRITRVLQTPAYTTLPPSQSPTGRQG